MTADGAAPAGKTTNHISVTDVGYTTIIRLLETNVNINFNFEKFEHVTQIFELR